MDNIFAGTKFWNDKNGMISEKLSIITLSIKNKVLSFY